MKKYATPLSETDLSEIAAALRAGATALMPTDTVYGIAAHPSCAAGVAKLFALKHRDASKPLPLLAASSEAVAECGLCLSAAERAVAKQFWPGALTLIVKGMGNAAAATEGVRVPDNATARALCAAAGGLLRCTSANESGETPALDAAAAAAALPDADILVDGGAATIGFASAVAKITADGIEIIREGAVSKEDMQRAINNVIL